MSRERVRGYSRDILVRGGESVRLIIGRAFSGNKDRSTVSQLPIDAALLRHRPVEDLSYLEPPAQATDAYEAISRWWAQAVLNPTFEGEGIDGNSIGPRFAAQRAEAHWMERSFEVGDFSLRLELLSRERGLTYIATGYEPLPVDGDVLVEVARSVDMRTEKLDAFPWYCHTRIDHEGNVWGAHGEDVKESLIWQPTPSIARE